MGVEEVSKISSSQSCQEDEERYWSRSAPKIQQLFHLWDCNQLSNESFMAKMQSTLGDCVDLTMPDSEFIRLTNKHRTARNLKFTSLMLALRADYRIARTRRKLPETPSRLVETDGNPVEGAAGVPSSLNINTVSPGRCGKRHYLGTPDEDTHFTGWKYPIPQNQQQCPGSSPGVSYRDVRRIPSCVPNASNPDQHEEAWGNFSPLGHDEYDRQVPPQGVGLDAQYWQRQPFVDTRRVTIADDVSEVTSQADVHREEFFTRNRGGHGNILTWGSDSRSITPAKKRQGRQMTVDPEYGVPKSHLSSGIFDQN